MLINVVFLPKEIEEKVTFCAGSFKIKEGIQLTHKEMEIFEKTKSDLEKALKSRFE